MNDAVSRTSAPTDRLAGLALLDRGLMQQALSRINENASADAEALLAQVLAHAPDHPEALRLLALLRYRRGAPAEAVELLRRALATWPNDAISLSTLGGLLGNLGQVDEAIALLRRACVADPTLAAAWFNLGRLLRDQARLDEARDALERALATAPEHLAARILFAGLLASLGDVAAAATQYRRAIEMHPRAAQAWLGLVNLKTVTLDATESATLARLHATPGIADADRATLGFALGKVCEDERRFAEAFSVLQSANATVRAHLTWDSSAFTRDIDAIAAAFPSVPGAVCDAADVRRGHEVIFVVSLPRSGSTLIEQILAAHPLVEGASELPDLEAVIEEESQRRQSRFPQWVAAATAADWKRLGERYLERTQRWRHARPRFTDKMPDNWRLAGAALAMLPGARIVNARRDPVETSWSCFKQMFGPGRQAQSYSFADLGAYWRDYDRLSRHWSEIAAAQFRDVVYEDLIADSEGVVRTLLDFCDLPFDAACLAPHLSSRSVRTASAGQVRQPMRRDTARAGGYGALLDPLRRALQAR